MPETYPSNFITLKFSLRNLNNENIMFNYINVNSIIRKNNSLDTIYINHSGNLDTSFSLKLLPMAVCSINDTPVPNLEQTITYSNQTVTGISTDLNGPIIQNITIISDNQIEINFNENVQSNEAPDSDKKPAIVFVEDGGGNPASGRTYLSSVRGAGRSGNGNKNAAFGRLGDWAIDLVLSEKSPELAAIQGGGFKDNQHPLYQGTDVLTQMSNGMGALGWGSFGANAYNRASGVGSVALGFNNIAGPIDTEALGIYGDNIGQAVFGYGSRATGNVSFASGMRNTASGSKSVAMGNFNYATGDSTIALGKENWAQGASAVAIGFKNHAAGGGSVALGQENITWGTTNFTSGYQNTAGDTTQSAGTGGSATAMGKYNTASADASMALNRGTTAANQAATSMGLGTTADNVGMLAVGVNNAAGIGDPTVDQYYYEDGQYTGSNPGVAFVVGNGDIDSSNGLAGTNPSNAFVVNYDGSAALSGDLTIISDMRLKTNIKSLESTLSKVLLIDGKRYNLKSDESIEKIGFLAQEVQKVFPELVKVENDKDKTLSLNYQGMIPILLNAIKDQQKQIDELKDIVKNKF